MDIKQRLKLEIDAVFESNVTPLSQVEMAQLVLIPALRAIEKREECAELLKKQASRLRACVLAGFTHAPGAGTDLIDLEQLAKDLDYASRRSLGEDS